MGSDPRIQADAFDDLLCVQPFYFCICIQFIKVGNPQRQIGIGKSFTVSASVNPMIRVSIFSFYSAFLKKLRKCWSYVKKKYKLNMPFLRLAYPAKASAFSSNAA